MNVPMLDEVEWESMARALSECGRDIKKAAATPGLPLNHPLVQDRWARALDLFEELTGFRETNPNAIWHHRVSLYGPDCRACGRPLRTPQASRCAECGHAVPRGAG